MGWPDLEAAYCLLPQAVYRQADSNHVTAPSVPEAWHQTKEGQAGEIQPVEAQKRLCAGVPAAAG